MDEDAAASNYDELPDDAMLLRRVYPDYTRVEGDERRITTQVFDDPPDGSVSVYVEQLLTRIGLGALDVLVGHARYGLVAIRADVVRSLELDVVLRPVGDGGIGAAHAEVLGHKPKSVRRRMAEACDVLVWPT